MDSEITKGSIIQAIKHITSCIKEDEEYYITASRSLHKLDNDRILYNFEGSHYREFPDLKTFFEWYYGTDEERSAIQLLIKEYFYSNLLSYIAKGEVLIDCNGNVTNCDYSNVDFSDEDLKEALNELNQEFEY